MAHPERLRYTELRTQPEREIKPGHTTWLAPEDLRTRNSVTLTPQSLTFVEVGLPKDILTPYIATGPARSIISSRSVLAQLNVEILPSMAKEITHAGLEEKETCRIGIYNRAEQKIDITEETGIGRLGRWSDEERARGNTLEELITSNIIKIEGEKGKDWDYYRDQETDRLGGIIMRLDPTYRRHLLEIDEDIILTPDISGKKIRHKIDTWLQPVNGSVPSMEISQTLARLYLPEGIHGLIDSTLDNVPGNKFHINSPWLIGGETGVVGTQEPWPIRTEIIRPPYRQQQPDAIVVAFSKPHYLLAA
jgi:hypothetical protein